MKKLLLILLMGMVLCSTSECEKEKAYSSENFLDFTLSTDPEAGDEGDLYLCTRKEGFSLAECTGRRFRISTALYYDDGDEYGYLDISLTSPDSFSVGKTYRMGDSGLDYEVSLTCPPETGGSSGTAGEPGGEDNPASRKAYAHEGFLTFAILDDGYAVGRFEFDFDMPVYDRSGQMTGYKTYHINDAFFNVYF